MDKNNKIILYKDDDNTDIKTLPANFYETSSQAIYRISPVLIKEETGIYYTINKTTKESSSKLNNIKKEMFWNKYETKEDDIGPTNIIDEIIEPIEVKQAEEEDQPRKFLDKDNLIKSFLFAFDPLSVAEYDEEDESSEVRFENINDRLEKLFDIKS
jgi:hypothetical protein